jgi:hypothetical protein
VESTGAVRATLVALAAATASASPVEIRASDGRAYRIPDVLLHSDQGIYRPNGAQQPFRRGARSYVIVRRVTVSLTGLRMVLVDEQVRCGGLYAQATAAGGPDRAGRRLAWLRAHRGRPGRCGAGPLRLRPPERRARRPARRRPRFARVRRGVCPCCARREAGLTQTLLGPRQSAAVTYDNRLTFEL